MDPTPLPPCQGLPRGLLILSLQQFVNCNSDFPTPHWFLQKVLIWIPQGSLLGGFALISCKSLYSTISVQFNVVPDVQIPEQEERRLPRQCNWQKGEVNYWLEPGPSAASNAGVQVREPGAQAVTQIYRMSTCHWFVTSLQSNFICQNFCPCGTFLGVSAPFLIS